MYKLSYRKRLSKKMSERAKRGWRVRRLRMEAEPREVPFEEIVARHKSDRKGSTFDVWTNACGVSLEIRHSLAGRSDQFDVRVGDSDWQLALSMPKVLRLWADLVQR